MINKDKMIDFFFLAGASRWWDLTDLAMDLVKEDLNIWLSLIYYLRDRIDWTWERELFRKILVPLINSWAIKNKKGLVQFIIERWRLDDMFFSLSAFWYFNREVKELFDNWKPWDLIYKWLPRRWRMAKLISTTFWLTRKQYRQKLSSHTKVIETNLTNKDYTFKYDGVPSLAFLKYWKAFRRNDEDRLNSFLEGLKTWENKINSKVTPYDLVRKIFLNWIEEELFNAQWENMENFIWDMSFLPVCDTSPSMSWNPIIMSVGLWLYLASKNEWPFKNKWLTFNDNCEIRNINSSIYSYASRMRRTDWWGTSTSLTSIFDKYMEMRLNNPSNTPKWIIIISDMAFNDAISEGSRVWEAYLRMKERCLEEKIPMPIVVFWNVNDLGQRPVRYNQYWTAILSWNNPAIIKLLADISTPEEVVYRAIEKYKQYL